MIFVDHKSFRFSNYKYIITHTLTTGNLQGNSIEFYIQNLHKYTDLLREYPIIRKIIRELLSKCRDFTY